MDNGGQRWIVNLWRWSRFRIGGGLREGRRVKPLLGSRPRCRRCRPRCRRCRPRCRRCRPRCRRCRPRCRRSPRRRFRRCRRFTRCRNGSGRPRVAADTRERGAASRCRNGSGRPRVAADTRERGAASRGRFNPPLLVLCAHRVFFACLRPELVFLHAIGTDDMGPLWIPRAPLGWLCLQPAYKL
jgi:hypothetical protein